MTGRDIVKFIVHNNLLDKSVSDLKLLFLDYTVDIERVKYDLKPNGRFITSYISGDETYKVSSAFLNDVRLDTLRCLDSCRSQSAYVDTYSTPFYTWMKSLSDDTSITHVLVVYAAQDPEFCNNCNSFNQLMSYLESQSASSEVLESAELVWTQYMHECRIIS